MTKEEILAGYGPDYYATALGSIPYERSAHWLNFFSIVADQIIRALRPHSVLDAGCAMGFLVEAFWDRGIYCEGFDISEYAIANVRRDMKDYCSVGSLTTPIPRRYDLITCIEVLEHLFPQELEPAVANLCAASDAVLISSSPSDFDEPTHHSVKPPIFWLQLFSRFEFWPDANFDASFITPHAILFRKGNPASEDFLRLFSEYTRYKMAFEARAAEVRNLEGQVQSSISQTDQLRHLLSESTRQATDLVSTVETLNEQIEAATLSQTELQAAYAKLQQILSTSRAERDQLAFELNAERDQLAFELNAERDQLAFELKRAGMARELSEASDVERQHLAAQNQHLTAECQQLASECVKLVAQLERVTHEKDEAQATVHAVLVSRAWRLAEKCRKPLRIIRQGWRRLRTSSGSDLQEQTDAILKQANPLALNSSNGSETEGSHERRSAAPECSTSPDYFYQRWIDEHEPTVLDLLTQRESADLPGDPLFSIIVPAHETDALMFKACVQSILEQSYRSLELCVVITPTSPPENRKLIRGLADHDLRIRLLELEQNRGISGNTNAALDLATGDFIALLDHDDTLAPFALFELASCLRTQPDINIVYSDHDYLDEQGLRCNPLFKPDWSPEIMFSANYITHLTVLRTSLIRLIGLFDPSTDGAQDWDFFFRATEHTDRIAHIPKILYHWRMHPGSTARNDSAKAYVANAQLIAIGRHMERSGMEADPEVMPDGLLHVRFRRAPEGMISIVIPTRDRVELLTRCISTLLEVTQHDQFEILIVDNGSRESATKEYLCSLENDARVRVLWQPGPFNYSAVNNRGAREARGNYLLFLNNDVEITNPNWLTELVSWANLPSIGIVGAKLLRANGDIQHAGVTLGMSGFADHPFADGPSLAFGIGGSTSWYRNYLAVTGACMMIRRQVFDELGGFDQNFMLCGSDVEICLRAHERGYRIVYNPFAELIHHEAQTRGPDVPSGDFVESFQHYRRWLLSGDPYWNPNLSLWTKQPCFRYRDEQSSLKFAEEYAEKAKQSLAASHFSRPETEEELIVKWFDCSKEQFEDLRVQNDATTGFRAVKRVLWFIPVFEVPFYGGIFTILRLCDYWCREKSVEVFFAVCGVADQEKMTTLIRQVFTNVRNNHVFVLQGTAEAAELPFTDVNICTLWTTPYHALFHKDVRRRFYLIQDFEPAFYRAGSISALVESTYRMGLYGIANTISLKHMYETEYGGKAVYFTPTINPSVFFAESEMKRSSSRLWQVFCYGRPKHPRNAFELVKRAMRLLKTKLGNKVRIVSAGDDWSPSDYGLEGVIENLGILAYEDTARLYRQSHVGVVLMLTRHPSYIPLELMASGCLTVTNENAWTSWLLKDEENCLLSPPTATALADTVERALVDEQLRISIRTHALDSVRNNYLNWSAQAEKIYGYLCDPETFLAGDGREHGPSPSNYFEASS